ncbi:MAG: hypothetical protein ACM3SY_05315 [Candidatus Omnitrophota bacterium]
MIDVNKIYKLLTHLKGWPVRGARTLDEATRMILGSPYYDIPEDCYKVIDKNSTYSLLAVYHNGEISKKNRYMAVNMNLNNRIKEEDD